MLKQQDRARLRGGGGGREKRFWGGGTIAMKNCLLQQHVGCCSTRWSSVGYDDLSPQYDCNNITATTHLPPWHHKAQGWTVFQPSCLCCKYTTYFFRDGESLYTPCGSLRWAVPDWTSTQRTKRDAIMIQTIHAVERIFVLYCVSLYSPFTHREKMSQTNVFSQPPFKKRTGYFPSRMRYTVYYISCLVWNLQRERHNPTTH